MTVSSTLTSANYNGNGVTTTFAVPFYFIENDHLVVTTTDNGYVPAIVATLVQGTDYTVTGAGNFAGGSIQIAVAPSATKVVAIDRVVPATQETHYVENDPFPADAHEMALDKLTMIDQQVTTQVNAIQATVDNLVLYSDATAVGLAQAAAQSAAATVAGLAGAAGAGLVGTIAAGAGAVARTVQDRANDTVSIFDFMTAANKAHCVARDGLFDATAAFQAAHNSGNLVDYGAGSFLLSGPVTIEQGGIRGRGRGVTRFYSTDSTSSNDMLTYVGTDGASMVPLFEGFHIEGGSTSKPAGAALRFAPSSGELAYACINGISTFLTPIGVDMNAVTFGQMSDCAILDYFVAGVRYANSVDGGSGDFGIVNNHIGTSAPRAQCAGILQTSGGGLRIGLNKILGGHSGIVLAYNGSVQSGPLIIVGNSLENYLDFAVYLGTTGAKFGGVVIASNESNGPNGIVSDASGNLLEITIGTNYFTGVSGQAVSLTGVAGGSIAQQFISGAGGSSVGVGIDYACTNFKVAAPACVGITTPLIAGSATSIYDLDEQNGGGVSVTPTTTYGPFYIGQKRVNFRKPFMAVPYVVPVGSTIDGCVGVSVNGIDVNGFNLVAYGINNAPMTGLSWSARGIG